VSELFLHVEADNVAALQFYQSKRLGYGIPERLERLDTDRSAKNAGVVGQILLSKVLPKKHVGGSGFGARTTASTSKKRTK
jgi:ribosomal protein S18 acetylase RimI-like enzyme